MIRNSDILRPHSLLLLIFIIQSTIYTLYKYGLIESYKINFISSSMIGYVNIFLFFFIPIMISLYFKKTKTENRLNIECKNQKKIFTLIYIFLAISLTGLLRLTKEIFSMFGLAEVFMQSLTGQGVNYLVYGSGNTVLSVFSLVSLILLGTVFEKRNNFHIFTLFVNVCLLFIYSGVLNSRILLIQGIIFFGIIVLRRFYYTAKLPLLKSFLVTVGVIVFLVITSGYRDYERDGVYYTDSVIEWGVSRIADYSISTTNYSLEIANYNDYFKSTFPNNTLAIVSEFSEKDTMRYYGNSIDLRKTVGSMEYTNVGGFAQIYFDFKNYYILLMIFIGFVYAFVWKSFDKGKLLGIFIYPLIFYNLIESSRIYYLGTTAAQALLILSLFTYFICKKDYVLKLEKEYEKINKTKIRQRPKLLKISKKIFT